MKTKPTAIARPASNSTPHLPPPPDAHRYRAERPGKHQRRRVFTLHLQRILLTLLLLLMLLALFAHP